jgi:inhibitor of KinA sporulation pathway (predicted exonuclease)
VVLILPDRTFVIFDLEVTDLSVAETIGGSPEVIEVGGVKLSSDLETLGEFSRLVRPDRTDAITEFTTSLTGITVAMVEDALPWREVWREWADFTEFNQSRLASWGQSDPGWLRAAYRRAGVGYPHADVAVDVLSLTYGFAALYGYNIRGWSLAAACERFGVERKGRRHRALPDARSVAALLQRLSEEVQG